MMNKAQAVEILRNIGLLHISDRIKYLYHKTKNKAMNQKFKAENPQVLLPPDYLMYESFQLNYPLYYFDGKQNAEELVETFKKYTSLSAAKVLDWGCGPARVVRHIPEILGSNSEIHGTDYNQQSINWCSKHIKNVTFNRNELRPPLKYQENYFDIVYSISIFTHLSEEMHHAWAKEIHRIIRPDGIFLTTTHGEHFKAKLTPKEVLTFNQGKLVLRGKVVEGHRVFTAFHPPQYMKNLFKKCGFEVLNHQEGQVKKWGIEQDTWILRKK